MDVDLAFEPEVEIVGCIAVEVIEDAAVAADQKDVGLVGLFVAGDGAPSRIVGGDGDASSLRDRGDGGAHGADDDAAQQRWDVGDDGQIVEDDVVGVAEIVVEAFAPGGYLGLRGAIEAEDKNACFASEGGGQIDRLSGEAGAMQRGDGSGGG